MKTQNNFDLNARVQKQEHEVVLNAHCHSFYRKEFKIIQKTRQAIFCSMDNKYRNLDK